MNDKPLISVITVTYNAAEVIEKTMLSLKSQDYKDFEHLVIDGSSKDDTIAKIKAYSLPQTRIISEPDKGLYDAMNKGLRLAKGEYVIFLNAGDSFNNPATLRNYADKAKDGEDIIYGDTIIVDNEGKKISDRHLSAPDKLTKKSFSDGMLICHQAFMVKKDLTSVYDINYRFSADYDWCINCISKADPNKCTNLSQVTINYLNDGLTDNNKFKSLRERFRIMAKHYGLPVTLTKHFSFLFRALKRGSL